MPAQSRILHFIGSLQLGGAERMIVDIATQQRKEGLIVIIVCAAKFGDLYNEVIEKGLDVKCLNARAIIDLKAIVKLIGIIKKNRVNIVHSNFVECDIIGSIAATICKIPVIFTIHNTHQWHFKKDIKNVSKRILHRCSANLLATCIIADCKYIKRHYTQILKFKQKKIEVIYNPVNIDKFKNHRINRKKYREYLGIPANHFILINVGSLTLQKSQRDLIKIMKMTIQKDSSITLLIVGDGPLKKDLEKQIFDHHLEKNIKLLGLRQDVESLLYISDAFILTSKWEGLPISILEAMAVGLPIISTAVGGIPEIIKDSMNGFLINYGDYRSFSETILLLKNKILKTNVKYKFVEQFDISNYCQNIFNVYFNNNR